MKISKKMELEEKIDSLKELIIEDAGMGITHDVTLNLEILERTYKEYFNLK